MMCLNAFQISLLPLILGVHPRLSLLFLQCLTRPVLIHNKHLMSMHEKTDALKIISIQDTITDE